MLVGEFLANFCGGVGEAIVGQVSCRIYVVGFGAYPCWVQHLRGSVRVRSCQLGLLEEAGQGLQLH